VSPASYYGTRVVIILKTLTQCSYEREYQAVSWTTADSVPRRCSSANQTPGIEFVVFECGETDRRYYFASNV